MKNSGSRKPMSSSILRRYAAAPPQAPKTLRGSAQAGPSCSSRPRSTAVPALVTANPQLSIRFRSSKNSILLAKLPARGKSVLAVWISSSQRSSASVSLFSSTIHSPRARGEWIVLLNNDTEADERWLEEIHTASTDFPRAGSFASKMLFFEDRKRIDNCGFAVTRAGTAVDLGRDEQDGPAWAEPRRVFGACGGATAYLRRMLDHIRFLDPEFFITLEDLDLSFRGQLQGYECVFLPRAIVYHRLGATRKKNPAQDVFFSQRNIELAYLKNMPFRMILGSLPHRLVYELGGAAYFTRLGVGTAFFRAKLDALRRLPSLLRQRQEVQRRRTLTNGQLRSMLLRYRVWSKWRKFSSAWRPASGAAAGRGAAS